MAKLAFFVTVRRSGSEVMIFWTRATVEGVLAWVGWVGFGGRGEVWMGGHTWERDVAGYFLGGGDGGVVVGHCGMGGVLELHWLLRCGVVKRGMGFGGVCVFASDSKL